MKASCIKDIEGETFKTGRLSSIDKCISKKKKKTIKFAKWNQKGFNPALSEAAWILFKLIELKIFGYKLYCNSYWGIWKINQFIIALASVI